MEERQDNSCAEEAKVFCGRNGALPPTSDVTPPLPLSQRRHTTTASEPVTSQHRCLGASDVMTQHTMDGGESCQHCRPPINCCRYAVLRSGAMAVSIFYLMINLAGILGYAFFILCHSIVVPTDERGLYFLSYICIGVVFIGGINITFDSLLLNGIRKTKRKLILGWVVWYGIVTVLVSLGWLAGFIVWIYLVATLDSSSIALGIFFTCVHCLLGLIILPVMWLCFACVASHLATLTPSGDNVLISKLLRQNTRFGLVNLPPREDIDDE